MKRSFILILALTFVLTVIFASCSCGNDVDTENDDDKKTAAYVDGNDNVMDDPFDIEETEAAE